MVLQYVHLIEHVHVRRHYPEQMDYCVAHAQEHDDSAAADGVDALASLCCLLVSAKSSTTTTAYPSAAGIGVPHNTFALASAIVVTHVAYRIWSDQQARIVCYITCNYVTGCTLIPYDDKFTRKVGGRDSVVTLQPRGGHWRIYASSFPAESKKKLPQ